MRKKSEILSYFIIFLFTIPLSLPLIRKGFFLTDDGEWMIVRLGAFFEALKNGQLPVRYLIRLNNEFGYPLSDFAYPGFLYIGSVIHALGPGFIDSIKILIFLTLFLGSIFTFKYLRIRFDTLSSTLGSFVYLYTPYHLFDLYKRGSVGELLSICIIPFLFWQIEKKNYLFISLGIALLVLSHNIIAFISLPFIFIYYLLVNKKDFKKEPIKILMPFALGVLLSSFFFIPAIYDLRYIVFGGLEISDWRLFFADLNMIGLSSLVILAAGTLIAHKYSRNTISYFFIALAIFSLFMAVSISTFLWEIIPSSFILYPFRFLSILPIGLAFLTALTVFKLKKNLKITVVVIITAGSFFYSYKYLFPVAYLPRNDDFYLTNFATTTVKDEYMPKWVKEKPLNVVPDKFEVTKGDASIDNASYNSSRIIYSTNSNDRSVVRSNFIYFPGWKAYVDGKETEINYDNKNGVMDITVPAGKHNILLKFGETPVRLLSNLLSLAALIVICFLYLRPKRRLGDTKNS